MAFANAQKQYNNKEIDEATYKQSINTWADAIRYELEHLLRLRQ
ncbi:hypothetical protein [Lactobacillus delbrueckii]|nr:hypothetical protein [Lactobacillus delbrueckii]